MGIRVLCERVTGRKCCQRVCLVGIRDRVKDSSLLSLLRRASLKCIMLSIEAMYNTEDLFPNVSDLMTQVLFNNAE